MQSLYGSCHDLRKALRHLPEHVHRRVLLGAQRCAPRVALGGGVRRAFSAAALVAISRGEPV